ncbi:MAG: pantoate--beta-alanine ligase [bacterium]
MIVLNTQNDLQETLENHRVLGKAVGFVPTMGALHMGHLSLLQQAKSENDIVVCSIFVNPTQFNDPKDLDKYPRPIENDIIMLQSVNCDILFLPEVNEMYGNNEEWTHSFGEIETLWEGAMRPGHFKGVAQIVYKLLKLVHPNKSYFGQKDYQQTVIVKKLCKDFSLTTEIIVCKVIREENGLAMSSRNIRLSENERQDSSKIYEALVSSKLLVQQKVYNIAYIIEQATAKLLEIKNVTLEYISIVDAENMSEVSEINANSKQLMIIALRIGNTRLIDNMFINA